VDTISIFQIVDLVGVFVGALTGALVGRRYRYDIMGHWFLALASGLGGGLLRDMMLQDGPPLALTVPAYLPTVLVATATAALFGQRIDQLKRSITFLDAFALANFAVAGALRTLDAGLGVWPAIVLGIITAVGGGLIRDMMTGQTPAIFQKTELYGLVALAVAIMVILLRELGSPREITVVISIAFGLFLRLGSLRWGWTSWEPR
jgi:uncharacterized membrane protein YeiH